MQRSTGNLVEQILGTTILSHKNVCQMSVEKIKMKNKILREAHEWYPSGEKNLRIKSILKSDKDNQGIWH